MFSFIKKKKNVEPEPKVNSLGESLDRLIDGELPFGWVTHHKDFVEQMETEYYYFLKLWYDARDTKNPREEFAALKSLFLHTEAVQKLCKEKGETYSFWCNEYLLNQEAIQNQTDRLSDLENNMDAKLQEYETWKETQHELKMQQEYENSITDEMMFDAIRQNEGMLQKDFCKMFPYPKAISNKLYQMAKEDKIERIKSGNSYTLKVK